MLTALTLAALAAAPAAGAARARSSGRDHPARAARPAPDACLTRRTRTARSATPPTAGATWPSPTSGPASRSAARTRGPPARAVTRRASRRRSGATAAPATGTCTRGGSARAAPAATRRRTGRRASTPTPTGAATSRSPGATPSSPARSVTATGATVGFARTTPECLACHAQDYARARSAALPHGGAGFDTRCQDCHQPWRFKGAGFPQHEACFPISSGHHAGLACGGCHSSVPPFLGGTPACSSGTASCTRCHSCSSHPAQIGGPPQNCSVRKCYECHPGGVSPQGLGSTKAALRPGRTGR